MQDNKLYFWHSNKKLLETPKNANHAWNYFLHVLHYALWMTHCKWRAYSFSSLTLLNKTICYILLFLNSLLWVWRSFASFFFVFKKDACLFSGSATANSAGPLWSSRHADSAFSPADPSNPDTSPGIGFGGNPADPLSGVRRCRATGCRFGFRPRCRSSSDRWCSSRADSRRRWRGTWRRSQAWAWPRCCWRKRTTERLDCLSSSCRRHCCCLRRRRRCWDFLSSWGWGNLIFGPCWPLTGEKERPAMSDGSGKFSRGPENVRNQF